MPDLNIRHIDSDDRIVAMSIKSQRSRSITFFVVLCSILFLSASSGSSQDAMAPGFQAVDQNGKDISLLGLRGEAVLLHITNIENPLCRECEHALNAQTDQLYRLAQKNPGINIITLNVRKNPYSKDGPALAKSWWNINVTWPWVEDFEPYPLTGKYIDYSTVDGGFANPTLILIDKEGKVSGLYHVYQLGKGEIDGIQSAENLSRDLSGLEGSKGSASEFKGIMSSQGASYLGMFGLGIVTSLSPCSVALLLAMFSYVMTARRKEEYLRKTSSASRDGFLIGVSFTLGMAAVFFLVGLFLSDIGVFIRQARFFDLAAGLLMVILGINILKPIGEMVEPVRSRLSFRRDRSNSLDGKLDGKCAVEGKSILERLVSFSLGLFRYSAFIGAFALGVFFALGWAPCAVSLVFPVLIWLVSQNIAPLTGGLMLFVFGVGHGLPVIPIATFSRAVGGQIGEKYISAGRVVTRIFGVAVIVIGLIYAARYLGYRMW
ncbi:MAG: Thiol:disulfide interchange protein DsbD [Methanosaeta sp. PtaU1.Bin112]|nr:MAG: Thiol:disulfide interchange protein DsbD [Methanosaeta sp. PtaU1.Bin112]